MTGEETAPWDTGEADILDAEHAGPLAVRGGAMRIGGYLGGSLVGLGAAALLYRHLGVHGVGQYGLILALIGIIGGFSDLGLTVVGVRTASTLQGAERTEMLRDLLGLRLVLTVAGITIVALICVPVYPSLIAAGVVIGGVGLALQVWLDNYAVSLIVSLRMGWVAAIQFANNVAAAVLTVALVLVGAKLLGFVAIYIPVGVVSVAIAARLLRGERALTPTYDAARWRAIFMRSVVYSAAVAAATLYLYAAIVLTSLLASRDQLGYLQLAFRVTAVLTVVPALLSGSALPIFARAARDDAQRLGYALSRVFEVALVLGAWVALTLGIGAPFFVELVGGSSGSHNFLPAVPVLVFQGVALGAIFVSSVAQYGLLSLALNRRILAISVGALVGAIVLMSVLIPLDGARGAAIATMIGELAAAAAAWVALCTARPELRPSLRFVPGIAAATLAGCAPLLISSLPAIVRVVLSSVLYFAVVLGTRSYPREVGSLLPRRLRPLLRGR